MKKVLLGLLLSLFCARAYPQFVTLTGQVAGANGSPAQNYTISFTPTQWFWVAGTAIYVSNTTFCATSTDGHVVGLPNPLQSVNVTAGFTGTLPADTYYVEYTFYTASTETLPSPEMVVQLTSTGQINIPAPAAGVPDGALGMRVYIGAASGSEQAQGNTIGNGSFAQVSPLLTGAVVPTINNTVCKQVANDAGWPTGTGYKTAFFDSSGQSVPNGNSLWQLLGPNTTIDLSNGFPAYHGVVVYPPPLLANPYNHNTQSISSSLQFGGYNILGVGKLGVGTSTPGWGIDVVGFINASQGYLVNGGAGSTGQCLVSNGTAFVPGSCGVSPTLYYQHVQRGGTLFPQEPFLNFDGNFDVADNPGSTRTDVGLHPTAVTAGSYTNPSLTVDAFGRLTAATNGTSLPIIKQLVITSGICTTANSAFAFCSFGATWGTAFADANYALTCSSGPGQGTNAVLLGLFESAKTSSGFTITLQNADASGAGATTTNEIDCIGMHP